MAQESVGTRFPFISLEKAIGRATAVFEADHRGNPLPVPTVFETWGYSHKSSGGFQTVAALKMYGLMGDEGANESRRLFLTQDALRYFRDEREEEKDKYLREFALTPKLFAALWKTWGASPPSDNVARSHLKLDRGLNEQSARSVLSIYKDNLAFANPKGSDKSPDASDGKGVEEQNENPPPSQTHNKTLRHQRTEGKLMEGEWELSQGLLSKTSSYRVIVSGEVGVKEIERLIRRLELDKEILSEKDEPRAEASEHSPFD